MQAGLTPEEVTAPNVPFSALLIPLPPTLTQVVGAFAHALPDQELSERGRELHPHVTVLDGLHAEEASPCRPLVAAERPFALCLGRTSAFRATETGQPYDVLTVVVESAALRNLHRRLAARLPHTCAVPAYEPHATLAFLQPGAAARYVGQLWVGGWWVRVDRLVFSSRSRQTEQLPLRGVPRSVAPTGRTSPERRSLGWAA